jgi:hypothetical protein
MRNPCNSWNPWLLLEVPKQLPAGLFTFAGDDIVTTIPWFWPFQEVLL